MTSRSGFAELASWLFAAIGVAFAVLSFFPAGFDALNALLIPGAEPGDSTSRVYAVVMGGVLAGFGTTFALCARGSVRKEPRIARALLAGVVTWFVVDTTGSALHLAWPNVIFNVCGMALLLPAVLRLPTRAPHQPES